MTSACYGEFSSNEVAFSETGLMPHVSVDSPVKIKVKKGVSDMFSISYHDLY